MTVVQRRDRRRLMSEDVAGGMGVIDTAEKWDVSRHAIYIACREFGVVYCSPGLPRRTARAPKVKIIARLFDRKATEADIAKEFGTTRYHVRKLRAECIEAGIPIPRMKATN